MFYCIDMNKVKCVVLNNQNFENVKKNLEEKLEIYELQTYFPILSLFFRFYNNSNKNFTMKMNNYIVDINDKISITNNDSYIKNFYECKIKNYNNGNITNKKIFFKILPLLNVSQYMMNEYTNKTSILPNIYSYLTNKKINNYHNSAYIDCFFSYLASNLTETGCCPTFPIFYGTYSGVAKEFKADITEEYSLMKNQDWFDFFNNKLFTIEKNKIDVNNNNISINSLNSLNNICNSNNDNIDIDLELNLETVNDLENNSNKPCEVVLDTQPCVAVEEENLVTKEVNGDEEENNGDEDNRDSDGDWSDVTSEDEYNEIFNNIRMQKVEIGDNEVEIKSVSELSASICSDISFNSMGNNEINFVKLYNFPVQLNCIEMLNNTLDNYLEDEGTISDEEWKSILFQICFGLAVAQKKYNFVHNDLHSSNIMFKNTELEYLYFNFKGKYFQIPTFGKIVKIIDFGRATFNVAENIFFSDVFKKNGDAEGQYSFPYNNTLNNCKIKPNKSFDLSRLATTIIQHFQVDTPLFNLLKLWASDKYGNFLMNFEDDFNLYKLIAKNVKSAIPKNQINKMIFKDFIIEKEDINKESFIYNY